MGNWVKHTDDDMLPNWLAKALLANCPICGSSMINYYNDDYRCTNRKCSNESCSGFVAQKGAFMFAKLGIKGIGYATCLDRARLGDCNNHLKLLSVFSHKPTIDLATFLRIMCFEGVDSEWDTICNSLGLYTLEELFEKYNGKHLQLLIKNKDLLYDSLQYVTLKERPAKRSTVTRKYLNIMITGTPTGYDTKEDFIDKLNAVLNGEIVILHQKTKRQSGVDYLIREPGSSTRGKLEAAIKGGIPIITSQEFVQILVNNITEIRNE